MRKFLSIVFILMVVIARSQTDEKHTLSGYVTDSKSGEALIGVKVYIPEINKGAITNTYGFYSLTVNSGVYRVEFRSTLYPTEVKEISFKEDVVLNLELGSNIQDLEEVIVNGKKGENVKSTQMGEIGLDIESIKTLPAFMGEVDVIKTIQLLPGVSSVAEGGQGFYVRGGGPDQNLVLLDEGIVYNAAHLFGFFSVFNSDAVKSVNLIKGGMPANYGGRMSSVLEVNMNEGNNKRFKVKGGIGAISSRLTVEGPLKKDKGSFIISGRRTYIDILMKAFIPDSSAFAGSGYFFYDLNAKFNYKLSDKDRIFLSGYYGKDVFTFADTEGGFSADMPWGNGIAALRWNHLFSNKLFMNVTTTFSDYMFQFGSAQDQFRFNLISGVRDFSSKVDFSYFPNTKHSIKWGANHIFHTFMPTSVSAESDSVVFDTGEAQKLYSHESALYFLDDFEINDKLKVNMGLRYSMYHHVGPFTRYISGDNISTSDTSIQYPSGELLKFYHGLEPRVAMRWLLPDNSSLKAGFSYNYQYVHLTALSAVSLPTDIWYPTTDIARPQIGWQASIGYFKNFFDDKLETSVEVYYKKMNNMIQYREGALPGDNVNDNTDNLLVFGEGWSYGAEFFIKKTMGQFTGWIGYTWAKSDRLFPDLNSGELFPAKYDRRHDLSIVGSYKLNDRWTFSTSFVYATGNTLTLPSSWYVQEQNLLFNYGARNSTRMAPYHRLDLSAILYSKSHKLKTDINGETIKVKKKFKSNWAFSIYNVYNRANPFFLYVDNDGDFLDGDFKLTVKQVSLFPIIPSVTWNFEF